MSNPNTVTIYSPEGEPFEMSTKNARDLFRHAAWTYEPKQAFVAPVATVVVPAAPEKTDGTTTSESGSREGGSGENGEAVPTEGPSEGQGEGEETSEVAAALAGKDRDEVVAYLAENHPDFKPHHKSGVESLIAKAVELASA